ncbi:hypothetical protein KSI01_02800 [Kurthia sibirica]|nr:hypothetical protein KSI01_02800 [Kurthia sibirica]
MHTPMKINGQWLFFNNKILTPQQVIATSSTAKKVTIPISFKELLGTTEGYGTFATYIKIPPMYMNKTMMLYIPYEYNAYSIFVNHKQLGSLGTVGQEKYHKSQLAPLKLFFTPTEELVLVTLQLSSFDLVRGGFEQAIDIGTATTLDHALNQEVFWHILISSYLFIVGIFMIIFGLYRTDDREFLIFGLFSFSIGLRSLFTVPFLYLLPFPTMDWQIGMTFEYLFTCTSTYFFILLIYNLYKTRWSKWVLHFYTVLIVFLVFIIVLLPVEGFQPIFFAIYTAVIPYCLFLIYVLVQSLRRKNRAIYIHIIGIVMVFTTVLIDFFNGKGWTQLPSLSFMATSFYVFMQMFALNKRFAVEVFKRLHLNIKLQELNDDLDEKILARTQQLELANEQLLIQANMDGLTGIYNRHYLNSFVDQAFKIALEEQQKLSILIIDVDDFKYYNDCYGHIEGDHLLKKLAYIMRETVPDDGMIARYGGEEFAVVLPNYTTEAAVEIGDEMQRTIANLQLENNGGILRIVTVSIGVATLHEHSIYHSVYELINAADQNLYIGKKSGKNKVVY